jgi:hypothetical protein
MKKLYVLKYALLLLLAVPATAQTAKIRFFVYNSTKPSGKILSGLEKHCQNSILTIDASKSDYTIQVEDAVHVANPKTMLVLYDKNGDSLFQTETVNEENAVKDVCSFLKISK